MSWYSAHAQRYVGLVVACLCLALGGSYFLVSIMSVDMQNEFGLTQTAVEVIVGVGSAAGNIGYPWGILLEHMSERSAFLLSMGMGSTCGLLLYAGDYFIKFYTNNWWLIAVLWGGVCSSFVVGYLVSMAVTLANFPRRLHGRVMGLLCMVWWLGQAFFNYLYTVTQHHHPPRIGNIFLIVGLCILVIKGMGAVFVRPVPLEPEGEKKKLLELNQNEKVVYSEAIDVLGAEKKEFDDDPDETWADTFGLHLLWNGDFHLVLWGFLCGVSVQMMYMGNVASICATLDLGILDQQILPYAPLFGMVVTFSVGLASDLTLDLCPRASYLALAAFLQTILFGLSTVYAEDPTMFMTTVLLMYGFNAMYYSLAGTILGDYFGMRHFKRNWGITIMCASLVAFLLVTAYGALFDHTATTKAGNCAGITCLVDVFIIGAAMSFLSFIAWVWLHRRFLRERQERQALAKHYQL